MPIRGENVGTAYVKILADGTGLADSIEDELDDTDGVFAEKGKAHGEEYNEGLSKQLKKDRPKTQKEVTKAFEVDTSRIRQLTEEMGSTFFKNIEKNVKKQYGETLGTRMLDDIRKGFVRGGGYQAFGKDMQGLFDRLPEYAARANAQIAREQKTFAREQEAVNRKTAADWRAILTEAETLNKKFDAERLAGIRTREDAARLSARRQADYWRSTLNEAYSMNAKIDREQARTTTNQQRRIELLAKAEIAAHRERDKRLTDSLSNMEATYARLRAGQANADSTLGKSLKTTLTDLRALRIEVDRVYKNRSDGDGIVRTLDGMERGLIRVNPRFRRFNGALDDAAPRIGKAFGKGSRNDFVNFFGSAIEGSTKLISIVPKAVEGFMGMSQTFLATLKSGQGLTAAIKGLGGTGGGALAGLAKAGPAAAAALGVLLLILPILASTVALLGGAITALAGSITFGLIGAAGALAGALLPVIAGLGVLVAGYLSLDDAQRKLIGQSLKPLTSEFKALGKIAAGEIFRDAAFQAEKLGNAIKRSNADVLVQRIGTAIRDVGASWVRAVDSPGFRNFVDVLSVTLPGQLRTLGNIIENTIGGLGGVFLGLQPITDRFLNWLDRITQKFSDFANSAEGQAQIVSFFERAGDSAASLGELIDNIAEALGELFTAGQSTGDTIIDQMAAKVQEFVDYLNANPEAVSKFFKQAGEFAADFGGAVKGVIDVFAALDSEASRSTASDVFEKLGKALQFIGTLGGAFADAFMLVKGSLEFVFLPLELLISLFTDGIPGAIATVINTFADFVDGLSLVGKAIDLLPGVDGVSDKIDGLAESMRGLANDVKGVKEQTASPVDIKTGPGFNGTRTAADTAKGAVQGLLAQGGKTVNVLAGAGFGGIVGKAGDARGAMDKLLDLSGATVNIGVGAGFSALSGAAINAAINVQNLINKISTANSTRLTAKPPTARGGVFGGIPSMPNAATGAFANFAQTRLIGESGREAVVPLERPLGQVDPAVRMLSAFAQGKFGELGGTTNSRTIDASGWTIVSNSKDPRRVADEAVDELAGAVF
jgi:hypothetical protein